MGGHVGDRPIEGNYVAIGWRALGDLRAIPADREAFKTALRQHLPDLKEGAVPVNAGTLYRFVHEMRAGDVVVYGRARISATHRQGAMQTQDGADTPARG